MVAPEYGRPIPADERKKQVGYRFYHNVRDGRYPATLFESALYYQAETKSRALKTRAAFVRFAWLKRVKAISGDGVITPSQMVDFNYCTPAGLVVGKFPQRKCGQSACPFCWCRRYTCSAFEVLEARMRGPIPLRLVFDEERFELPINNFKEVDLPLLQDQIDEVAALKRNRGKCHEFVLCYPVADIFHGVWHAVRRRVQLTNDRAIDPIPNRYALAQQVGAFYGYPPSWWQVAHCKTGKYAMWHPAMPLFSPRNGRRWMAARGCLYGTYRQCK